MGKKKSAPGPAAVADDDLDDLDLGTFRPEGEAAPEETSSHGQPEEDTGGASLAKEEALSEADKAAAKELESEELIGHQAEESAPATDEDAFGDDFGFGDGFGDDDDIDGFGGFGDDEIEEEPRKTVMTSLSAKFPLACQAIEGPKEELQILHSIAFQNASMRIPGHFSLSIRDAPDGKGHLLHEQKDISCSKQTQKMVVVLDPLFHVQREQTYFVHLTLTGGHFAFEVGDIPKAPTTAAEMEDHLPGPVGPYRFCVDQYAKRWITTGTNVSYMMRPRYQKAPDPDPERGEKSNWIRHTKTAQKKGTLGRRLSIKKRNQPRFMVYADSIITIHKEVDDKAIETIALKDVTAIHGEEHAGSRVVVIIVKGSEHSCLFKTPASSREWLNFLRKAHGEQIREYGSAKNTSMMF